MAQSRQVICPRLHSYEMARVGFEPSPYGPNITLLTTALRAVLNLVAQSCPTCCDPMDCSPPGSSVYGDSPGKNTGVGCHALLQGIFPIQGSNSGLLYCRHSLPQELPGKPTVLRSPRERGSQPLCTSRKSTIYSDPPTFPLYCLTLAVSHPCSPGPAESLSPGLPALAAHSLHSLQ